MVPLLQKSSKSSQVYWLATLFELKLGIIKALECHRSQGAVADTLKASEMNRLQLSINSVRMPNHAKDSTVRASNFMICTLNALDVYVQSHVEVEISWMVSIYPVSWGEHAN